MIEKALPGLAASLGKKVMTKVRRKGSKAVSHLPAK